MIPDLLQLSEIRNYIQKRTGIVVKRGTIKRWIKNRQIDSFKLSGKRVTTKRAVDRFIGKNIYKPKIKDKSYKSLKNEKTT